MAELFYTNINFEEERPFVYHMNKIPYPATLLQAAGQIEVYSPALISASLARLIRGR
jgi:hypothetical protein